jgi:regulator of sigma E protease
VNLLPIPILDGGHLLFYAGEAVLRRPIPRRAIEIGMRFGFALILSLFVFTTVNDLARLGAVDWVAHLFG